VTQHDKPDSLLRERTSHDAGKVNFVELFFDLVFVFAITQLSHSLLHHFTAAGLAETMMLLLAVWWVWMYTTWVTNWLCPQATLVRVLLFVLMFAGVLMSISIPHAFEETGLLFACSFVFMQVGRSLFMCWVLRSRNERNYRNFLRITTWLTLSGAFWIGGAFVDHNARYLVWGVAILIEYSGPALGFWTPRLGRSTTADWDVSGGHIAERCGLFIIIALGESLLVSGAAVADLPWTFLNAVSLLNAFGSTIAMWWIYFNISADYATRQIEHSDDPGRMARLAYTYLHLPLVAGIILVAVADGLVLHDPMGPTSALAAIAVLGGPAVYLLGNFLFKLTVCISFAKSRAIGIVVLAIAALAYSRMPLLPLSIIATLTLTAVGAWETYMVKKGLVTLR